MNGFIHNLLAVDRKAARIAGMLRGEGGVLRDFLGGSAELIDRGGDAVGTVGLLVGVVHRGVRGGDHAQGDFVDLAGGRGHFADRAVNAFDEAVELGHLRIG